MTFSALIRSCTTASGSSLGIRHYATRSTVRKSRTLSPNVAKSTLKHERKRAPQKSQRQPQHQQSQQLVAGPPNSGDFARLHLVSKRDRIVHKNTIEKVSNFNALRIVEPVRKAIVQDLLGHLQDIKPTPIQTLAVKAIRSTRKSKELQTFLLAAETGSGKTVAYLAPLMSHLKEQESLESWDKLKDAPIVRSVIFVPTLELVTQVHDTVKAMLPSAKLSCMAVGQGISVQSKITRRVDILITTPGKFIRMFDSDSAKSSIYHCKHAVVDEADTLMDDSFCEETHQSVAKMKNLEQLVFCSATIPRSFDKIMRKTYPDLQRIVTPGIHKVPRHIDFRVIEVFNPPFLNSKPLALQQALYAIHHDNTEQGNVKRVVVFVNRSESVESVVNNLSEKGYPAVGVTGAMTKNERVKVLNDFVSPAKKLESESQIKVQVLVTTDLMARGVDMQNVRNVILYDLPYSSVDLLHRAGRTGRLGKRGRVFVFVDRKESRGWVKGLERVVRNGMPLA